MAREFSRAAFAGKIAQLRRDRTRSCPGLGTADRRPDHRVGQQPDDRGAMRMLMDRHKITRELPFHRLRSSKQRSHRKLAVLVAHTRERRIAHEQVNGVRRQRGYRAARAPATTAAPL